jgi:hypothetical protein
MADVATLVSGGNFPDLTVSHFKIFPFIFCSKLKPELHRQSFISIKTATVSFLALAPGALGQ